MPEMDWNALVSTGDDFKIAIRGFTAIETLIDEELEAVLLPEGGNVRQFGAGFLQRLRLAVALHVVAPPLQRAITTAAQVRNDFAHGKRESLDTEIVDKLIMDLHEPMEEAGIEGATKVKDQFLAMNAESKWPVEVFSMILVSIYTTIEIAMTVARQHREGLVDAEEVDLLRARLVDLQERLDKVDRPVSEE